MTIGEHLQTFGGLPVVTVEGDAPFPATDGPVAWRSAFEYDAPGSADEALAGWLARVPAPESVTALLVGPHPEPYDNLVPVGALAEAAGSFPALEHLFLAELTYEENEISWTHHGSLDPVLAALGGQLRTLRVRGGYDYDGSGAPSPYTFTPFTSTSLRELAFESGGLPGEIVAALAASTLPALESLEIWFGSDNYGATTTVEQVAQLCASDGLPALTHLSLCNSEDPLAHLGALRGSPLLARIKELDLSKGVVGDECVEILTDASFAHLETIRIEHHYLTEEGVARLAAGLPDSLTIHLDEAQHIEDDDETGPYAGRWIEVSE